MIIILIISVLFIYLLEGVTLIKKKLWKELTTVTIILSIAIFLEISKNLGMITAINLIEKFLEPIGRLYLNKL